MNKLIYIFLLFSTSLAAQINLSWAAYYNGKGDFNDRYTCEAEDNNGNIIMGGSTTVANVDRDFLIVKINASGDTLWTRVLNGTDSGPDEVRAIKTDNSGNIYATGLSKGLNTSTDYLTLKLDANGNTIWMQRYDYVNEYDQPNDLAIDAAGNVIVTGLSDGDSTSFVNDDYATIKYSPNGTQLWAIRFNGLGNATDQATALVLDNNNAIYVTGRSNNGDNDDYVTIKYSLSGQQQWIKYDDRGGRDRATAMTSDGNNIYITGQSSNGDNDDFWTLKYNTAGVLQWDMAYDFVDADIASNIDIDNAGNVYVAGQSNSNIAPPTDFDFLLIAYNNQGNQLWSKRFDSFQTDDILTSLAISQDGSSIYITGTSDANLGASIANQITTNSYTASNGGLNWSQVIPTSGNSDQTSLAVIPTNTGCMIAGYFEDIDGKRDAAAIQYNTSGTETWQSIYNGIGDNNDNVLSLVVDDFDNVYTAGYSVLNGNNRDMALAKFVNGAFDCEYTFDGTSPGSEDEAVKILTNDDGTTMMAGSIKNSATSYDMILAQVGGACDSLNAKVIDGNVNGSDRVYDCVRDASNNFYLTGRNDTDPSNQALDKCYTAKLDVNGNILWSKLYSADATIANRGSRIRVNATGDVYVVGKSVVNLTNDNIFILKYNSAGVQQWAKIWDSGKNEEATDMELDQDGNILITGYSQQTADTLNDYITLKYNPSGTLLWEARFDNGNNDIAKALTTDNQKNVYVTGSSANANLKTDMITVKYNAAGAQVWTDVVDSNSNNDDSGIDIATNNNNQICVVGQSNNGTNNLPNWDVITKILSTSGINLWSQTFSSSANDYPAVLFLKGSDMYIGANTYQSTNQLDVLVLKYSGVVTATETPEDATLSVFPNPFENQLTFQLSTYLANGRLSITDALGRNVYETAFSGKTINITLPTLTNGIYFYQISNNKEIINNGKLMH